MSNVAKIKTKKNFSKLEKLLGRIEKDIKKKRNLSKPIFSVSELKNYLACL
jgi:FAD synthase